MNLEIDALVAQVQHNCHISDARHGTDYGLCTYLMKMREYYRWEQGLPYATPIDKDEVGDWLSRREALWDSLAGADYQALRIGEHRLDPFDVAGINLRIADLGYLYSAGLVHSGRAQFFLTRLRHHVEGEDGFHLWIGDRELARGLHVPPALLRGRDIFLRRDSLKQLLWEKYESWLWSRPDNAMGRALACYPFERDVEQALEMMTEREMQVVRDHEIGEYQAGQMLGEAWEGLLLRVLGTPAELMLRAVRDHLADCLRTLPAILDDLGDGAVLHAYIGNLGHMRKALFPALQSAYEAWRIDREPSALRTLAVQGRAYWRAVAEEALALDAAHPEGEIAEAIKALVEARRLAG